MGEPAFYTVNPPHNGTETSREAAEAIRPSSAHLRARVFEVIEAGGDHGATADEVQATTGITPNTINPRMRELAVLGRIHDSGQKRKTRSGRNAVVWVTTPPAPPAPPLPLVPTTAYEEPPV